MSLPMTVWSWLKKQFSAHTVRSVSAVFLALALLVTGSLWAGGVFKGKAVEETFTYLPNRTYRVADPDPPEPETLGELLHADEPTVDTLLRHPEITQELLQAEGLTDIVDSRLALNNLRSLDRQLSERLGEAPDSLDMIDLAELRAHAGIGLDAVASEWDSTYRLLATTYSPGLSSGYFPGLIPVKAQEQQESLVTAKSATSRLLKAADRSAVTAIPANMNMKCVWQAPAEGLVHLVPSGAWLPEQGYKLYRIVNGSSTLIAEQLAAPQDGLNGSLGLADAAWIKELYAQAALTPAKLTALGMDAAKFNEIAYKTDSLQPPSRVSGALDFDKMREALITIPSGLEQRIPETDLLLRQPIYVMGRQDNTLISSAAIRSRVQQKFSVLSPQTSPLISAIKSEPGGNAKSVLMQSILSARQQIATLSFVDDDFAEAAGFLVRDDLTSLQLPNGTKITYQVETPDGAKTAQSITAGTETSLSKPLGLSGYGIDGKVPLRWQQAAAPAEKAILSGYWIERKLEGDSGFSQVNDEPIVVSYLLDETGVYFESPVFFEDAVNNGLNVSYRIRSLDVFGRTSEYSDPISFLVEKVTPPNAPAIDPPDLSTDLAASDAARQAIAANPGQLGIVLPIYTDSPDTVRFTVYRAVAHGAQSFGTPEVLANLTYHNPMPDAQPTFGVTSRELPQVEPVTKNNAKQLVRTNYVKASPNLIYFDAHVAEGYTYKYWVSAWDSWNNESAWSKSASAGVPTKAKPAVPGPLAISMLSRELPDFSQEPPGILRDELVAKKDLSASAAGSVARVYATDIETVKSADQEGIAIGHFIPAAEKFSVIDMQYDNLPEDKYIHLFVAVRGEDVLPDGTARVRWPAYSGDGLGGYSVYAPEFPLQPLEAMQQMSRAELVELGRWRQLNDQPVSENQFLAGGLNRTPGSFALFLICLVPEGAQPGQPAGGAANIGMLQGISNHFALMAEGGFVSITWSAPDDPQIKHYRVYRSEVASFKKPVDESALVWTLVGDHIKAAKYTERVEQTFAHYYYYKVTSVTPWGVESAVGSVERFRVPATKPPQTPTLLLPLSRKDGIEINFSAVGHCSRYEVYRTEIPRPSEIQINQFMASHEAVAAALFDTPSDKDSFFSGLITRSLKTPSAPITVTAPIRVIDKFKTMTTLNKTGIVGNLNSLNNTSALTAYKQVLASHGPLALADYADLSIEMLHMINWTKVGELPVDEDTVEAVDPATGLLKPLSIIDMSAVYGKLYLYTVQAWNDDNLGSGRPEPVEATTRRNAPFDPIAGLKSDSLAGQPSLSWNPATMANLTWQQCREDTVGYIVYRSDTQDGEYLQASPLLLETKWTDGQADRYAFNWYKVKVLDTGGYLSEFSEPLLIRRLFMPALEPVIPPIERLQPETILPDISVRGKSFTVQAGSVLQIPYELTGTEPIEVTLTAVNQKGVAARGIALDATTRFVRTSKDLPAGTYTLTLTAVNKAGEDSVTFTLEVTPKPTASPGPTTKPTPTPTPTTAPRPTVTPTSKPTPALVPPTVKLDKSSYTVYYPDSFTAKYTLQGSEPITLELKVYKADGSLADGFTLDTAARTIKAGTLRPGQYNGILTASNSVGKSEVRFALSVEMRTPPVLVDLENNVIEITHSVFPVRETTVSFTVSGTTPFTWSLRPIEKAIIYNRQWIQPAPVPADVKIDSSGKLTIRSTVAVGVYAFDVVVSNAVGSDFQTIILVVKTGLSTFGQAYPLPTDSSYVFLSATSGATPTPEAIVTPVPQETFKSDRVSCLNFVLTQVELSRPVPDEASLLAGRIGYAGTALLDLGYSEPVPVQIINGDIVQDSEGDKLRAGTVYLAEPHSLDNLGLTLVSMNITPQIEKLTVSGYMQRPDETQNLVGDLHTLEFTDAKLRYGFIDIEAGLPDIRYQRLRIHDIGQFRIRLDGAATGNPDIFILRNCKVAMKSHLETLNNEGLLFTPSGDLAFNQGGELRGTLATQTDQSLQLLVPGGTALRVADASLTFAYGSADPTGYLKGKLVLPFEKAVTYSAQAVNPGALIGDHPTVNEMDSLVQGTTVDAGLKIVMHNGLLHFGEMVQINGLRLVPNDPVLMDACSFASIDIADWNGKGFMLESAYLTPTSIADRSLSAELQEVQAIAVVPTEVTIDLDREGALPKAGGSQTPNETEKPFWVGMVLKGGTLTLPPAFIQTSSGTPIVFTLAEGEMIYDLNGFNYQTFLYNPNGVPAKFGEELGSFQDVMVYNCLLDMYANRVNLEINAEVAVDLFLKNRVKVKLYTNKEDNADGPKGKFLCSVAPTKIEQGIAEGIDVTIDGGWLKPDGMHFNGAFTVVSDEVSTSGPLAFTDMVVPANKKTINGLDAAGGQLAAAELDKPVNVDFQGFTMEIRAIDLGYRPRASEVPGSGSVWMVLMGSTLLSENIPLSTETTDNLIIECPNQLGLPVVIYEQSQSVLTANFDGCVDVSGVLVPELTESGAAARAGRRNASLGPVFVSSPVSSSGDGLVEFDTDTLLLGFLGGLNTLDIDAVTRFGYDMNNNRCYFAVGLLPASDDGAINFGAGDVEDFTGMVVYNMVMGRDEQNRFAFPDDPGQIAGYVENLPVHTAPDTFFGAGIKGLLRISDFCEIRDLYFGFGSGPVVDASGGLWLPLDVPGMIAGNGFKKVGSVAITYNHPERYFSFSMTIDDIDIVVAKVGGSIGFEFSPHLFGVYIGYPETLAGNISIFRVGVGLGFRVDTEGESLIKAKIEFGVEKDLTILIVYIRGYLYAGADGAYYFGGEGGDRFVLELYLKGGIEGGIIVSGNRYNIIGFYLDARGRLESRANDAWLLYCSCEVSYSLDLWLFSVEGSISASFDTTIG